jgi:hypothetical protein
MWFLNPNHVESKHYCWENSAGQPADSWYSNSTGGNEFNAKCEDGWAKISIAAGDGGTAFQRHVDVEEPYCQDNDYLFGDDLLQYNGLKRCYWEFLLPCNCDSDVIPPAIPVAHDSGRLLEGSTDDDNGQFHEGGKCAEESKAVDITKVQVDKCTAIVEESPLKILSQDKNTVELSLSQIWKGCQPSGANNKLSWIAADYVGADGELTCSMFNDLECGLASTLTATCQDGATVVDLYTYDSESDIFGQADNAPLVVPLACTGVTGSSGDATRKCHYRYIVQCEPSLCASAKPAHRLGAGKEKSFWSSFFY